MLHCSSGIIDHTTTGSSDGEVRCHKLKTFGCNVFRVRIQTDSDHSLVLT